MCPEDIFELHKIIVLVVYGFVILKILNQLIPDLGR